MTYSQTLKATGGTAPYTFTLDSGKLPPGCLIITGTGEIRGFPDIRWNLCFRGKSDRLSRSVWEKRICYECVGFHNLTF